MGYAAAMAILLFAVAFMVTVLIMRHVAPLVHYQRGRADDARPPSRPAASPPRRAAPARAPAQALLVAIADHSLLIGAALAFMRRSCSSS